MLDTIGSIASIIGLLLTVWAVVEASGARKAAQQAREAVRLGSAADEFRQLDRLASEFLGYVENSQTEAAALRARDLVTGILAAKERWRRFLTNERVAKLEEASIQVGVISRSLLARKNRPTGAEQMRLLKFSHEIIRIIAEETGTMISESETRNDGN
jgi:hypothetical protein